MSLIFIFILGAPTLTFATGSGQFDFISGLKVEFVLFGLMLLGVALFHHHTLKVGLIGLAVIVMYKFFFTQFNFIDHAEHEWMTLLNLLGLLLGFTILAKHFEESGIPQLLPNILPDDWKGGFVLLLLIFIMSSFLDNIAAAIIGGTIAQVVFNKKIHVGYIAAIVAASNAGGSGSVVGDTTTTMMWIDGVDALSVLHAYYAAVPAVIICGIIASIQQDKYHRILRNARTNVKIDLKKLGVVIFILIGAILTNIYMNFPALGVWIAIAIGAVFTSTYWKAIPSAIKGSIFLLSLVLSASMMPVEELPVATWQSTFSLGFISAIFDNIPLTKLALEQGGYDWGVLAFAVGFGGSMIWFGSSAGVALSTMFPEAKSVVSWIKNGWHVILAYVISFFIMLGIAGWEPTSTNQKKDNSIQSEISRK